MHSINNLRGLGAALNPQRYWYKRVKTRFSYSIKPVGRFGMSIFLANFFALLLSVFWMPHSKLGLALFFLSLTFYIYSIVKKTDYTSP